MPDRVQLIQLVVILLAVPVQYLLTRSSTENVRQFELKSLITGISDLHSYFDVKGWIRWCKQWWQPFGSDSNVNSASDEVLKYFQQDDKFFAASSEPRSPRPPFIKYRVGQVFKHRIHGYRGVIIGWDETARAPDVWLDKMHKNRKDWREWPNYSVLVDTRDRLTPQMAYVVEENIEIMQGFRIFHPLVDHYFEDWDGGRYLIRPWLKKVYPQD